MNNNEDVKITYKVNGVVEFSFGMFIGYEAEMEYNHTTREHAVKEYQFMKPKQETIESELTIDSVLTSPSPFTEPCTIEYYYELFGEEEFRIIANDMINEVSDFEESFKERLPEMMKKLETVHEQDKSIGCSACLKNNTEECEYCNGVRYDMEFDYIPHELWVDKIEVIKIENIQGYIRNLKIAKELAGFMDTLLEYEGKPLGYEYCMRLILERMEDTFIATLEACNTLFDVKYSLRFRWGMTDWLVMIGETLYDKVKARGKGW